MPRAKMTMQDVASERVALDAIQQWIPPKTEKTIAREQSRKKWWENYRTVVSNRDVRRLNGTVKLPAPRRLAPLTTTHGPTREREEEIWNRIYQRRDRRAMDAQNKSLEEHLKEKARAEANREVQHESSVPKEKLEAAKKAIMTKWKDKFSTMQQGFLVIDSDRSGRISKEEFKRILATFNLNTIITGPVFDAIFNEMDTGKSQHHMTQILVYRMPQALV